MSKTMTINGNSDQEGIKWHAMLVLSLLLHGVLFSMLFWVPGNNSRGLKMNEVAYEVNIVDASTLNKLKQNDSNPSVKQSKKSTAVTDRSQAKRISSARNKKNTVTLAKRTVKKRKSKPKKNEVSSDRLLSNAISKIEKKVKSDNDTDYLDKTIAALGKKVGASEGGKTGGVVSEDSLAMNMYKMKVETWIKSQWSYSDALGNHEAIVVVKISKDGTVLAINLIKPSGNGIFDESVLKAIEQAKPLPPLPEEYRESYEEIEINFNLKDLE